jgi:hypothetical protein
VLRLPQAREVFVALVDQAIYEMEELAVCADEDYDDEMADLVPSFRGLAQALTELKVSASSAEHQFADGHDLKFMPLARRYRHVIPFFSLLDDFPLSTLSLARHGG